MTEALRKPDWIPYYIQRIKGSTAWQLEDFKFCWYWKLLTECADSELPGYLVNDVRTLWRLAGARTEKFFRERGGMELVARYFSRTDDGLHIYNGKLLEVLHEQMKKLTRRRKSQLSSISLSLQELPSWLSGEVFQEYINMREQKKKPLTPYAMKLTIAKLGKMKEQGHDPTKLLESAIANCWTGIWAETEQVTNGKHQGNDVGRPPAAKSLTDPNCKVCSGTGWDRVDNKAFECQCRRRNKANATNGTANGRGTERANVAVAGAGKDVAQPGNDGRRV